MEVRKSTERVEIGQIMMLHMYMYILFIIQLVSDLISLYVNLLFYILQSMLILFLWLNSLKTVYFWVILTLYFDGLATLHVYLIL